MAQSAERQIRWCRLSLRLGSEEVDIALKELNGVDHDLGKAQRRGKTEDAQGPRSVDTHGMV
jgi:hypothetical protein